MDRDIKFTLKEQVSKTRTYLVSVAIDNEIPRKYTFNAMRNIVHNLIIRKYYDSHKEYYIDFHNVDNKVVADIYVVESYSKIVVL